MSNKLNDPLPAPKAYWLMPSLSLNNRKFAATLPVNHAKMLTFLRSFLKINVHPLIISKAVVQGCFW